ncbi:hypothetical protein N7509_007043 [Penicillium cosmopolitanum]|uniref:Major facilitator superfamily (MFS) profile domain-containing protein n=1 Tax=Penicillium cosmopolitanum TaxID=1131564 RepID=A0A9X0B841_9EURO|nr:uncharacterized protein N7509_007043 [Penicillium cosmopolitanum]KAJ5391553.1 hypothetical protein N7509_007043 [Penicillium cosmopolitanum]
MSTQTQTQTEPETEAIILQTRTSQSQTSTPTPPQDQPPKWLYPKILSAGLSFFVAGVNDGSLGSLIPYIIRSYNINTNTIAILYGTTFSGWFIAALTNSTICQHLDFGSILCIGAALQVLAHTLRSWFAPFPLYAVTFFLASLGQAYNDTHANTFVSELRGAAHRWLGFIHAMYMAGCLVGPFVATGVASANAQSRWNLFYIFPLGLGVVNFALVGLSFYDRVAVLSRKKKVVQGGARVNGQSSCQGNQGDTIYAWSLAVESILLFFLGAAITAGGWMVEYLVNVRNGDVKNMGYVPAGFYGGAFLGRLVLAEPTHRLGERRMIFIYAVLCVGLQLVFWLVPNIITEAVAVSLLGFFSGPFFATGIFVGSKIFRPEIRSSAIAFVFVLGQIGGSIFPAITGIIAARVGVKVLQPILVGLLGAAGASWLLLPKNAEVHRE